MSADVAAKLNQLAEFQAERDILLLDKQALIDQILTPEIKVQIAEVEVEFLPRLAAVDEKIAALDEEVRAAVLLLGDSVKGERLHAVFGKGRVSWDTKGLDGYAKAHPEVGSFKNQGEPTVTIRRTA